MVRFYDEEKRRVTDALLDVIEVDDANAESLYKSVKELLQCNEIPLHNIIGFGSDNCSTMLGAHKGFQAYLKKDVPSVFILGCVWHSFALCASHAASTLPSWLESFLKDVCNYFARSSKRQHLFQMIQDVAQTPKHNAETVTDPVAHKRCCCVKSIRAVGCFTAVFPRGIQNR
ncbi:hypothetical protein Pcinc_010245 [Petrolisthes cinctipes]|uniref:DUF4371 domain-containing protein n=1 Tax=Petrolisthes cinctipes TaxID=88211 RepID=A0AAE1KUN3_PETCI|nr:hypothetical protein Pcinc_010245 [Petrolisthes cinctipes]